MQPGGTIGMLIKAMCCSTFISGKNHTIPLKNFFLTQLRQYIPSIISCVHKNIGKLLTVLKSIHNLSSENKWPNCSLKKSFKSPKQTIDG